jgi:mevalonate kinase
MGSGAAVTIAIIRALSAFFGKPLSTSETSELAFEVEKIHHGTPSGIDNAVIANGKPVFFQHGHPIEVIQTKGKTHWLIVDSGEKTPTLETVSDVQRLNKEKPQVYMPIINKIGELTNKGRGALRDGEVSLVGELMNENHSLLRSLQVSSPKLDLLTTLAREAGAYGAKLSGGGRGGSIIVLTNPDKLNTIEQALLNAGAAAIISTVLTASEET